MSGHLIFFISKKYRARIETFKKEKQERSAKY
jgi:hypothetical protein